jgi:UPF0716 protein FxsA
MRFPLLAFIVIPIAELLLLFEVADMIGGLATLGLVICTAFIGLSVLRRQGFNTLNRANQRMEAGQLPGHEIVEGMMLAVAGALLLTPGLITDAIGFCLLTPMIRRRLADRVLRTGTGFFVGGFQSRNGFGGGFHTGSDPGSGPGRQGQGDIIDGEVVDKDDPAGSDRLSSRDQDPR